MSHATLFSSVRSPHCLKVAIVLQEKRVRFETVEIDLPARQQKSPAYLAIDPRGQIPAYLDDAGAQLDSLDVMLHLEARHPEPRMLPSEPALRRQRGRWLVPAGADRDRSGPAPSLADVAVYAWVSGYSRFGLPRNAASLPTLR
ncbi:MAG: glutathione S-transferase family protein [Trueperaceae bacterium]